MAIKFDFKVDCYRISSRGFGKINRNIAFKCPFVLRLILSFDKSFPILS